jgi:hypothetical protein
MTDWLIFILGTILSLSSFATGLACGIYKVKINREYYIQIWNSDIKKGKVTSLPVLITASFIAIFVSTPMNSIAWITEKDKHGCSHIDHALMASMIIPLTIYNRIRSYGD